MTQSTYSLPESTVAATSSLSEEVEYQNEAMSYRWTFIGGVLSILLWPIGFLLILAGLYKANFLVFLCAGHPLMGLLAQIGPTEGSGEALIAFLLLWPLEWLFYGYLVDSLASTKDLRAKSATSESTSYVIDGSVEQSHPSSTMSLTSRRLDYLPNRSHSNFNFFESVGAIFLVTTGVILIAVGVFLFNLSSMGPFLGFSLSGGGVFLGFMGITMKRTQ
jgi:hypothetical protein